MTKLRFDSTLFLFIFLLVNQNTMYAMKHDENHNRFGAPKNLTKHYKNNALGKKVSTKKESSQELKTKTTNDLRDRLLMEFSTENIPSINTIELLPEIPTPLFNENNLFFNDHISTTYDYYPIHDDRLLLWTEK